MCTGDNSKLSYQHKLGHGINWIELNWIGMAKSVYKGYIPLQQSIKPMRPTVGQARLRL